MRQPPSKDVAIRRRRARRARDTANCRRRQRLGLQLLKIEVGSSEYDLAIRYADLEENHIASKAKVVASMGRLLRKALVALVTQEEEAKKR